MRPIRDSLRGHERHYGVSRSLLAREVAAGRLRAERIGSSLVVDDAEVRRLVAALLARALAEESRP
jgi:hypothetical protein